MKGFVQSGSDGYVRVTNKESGRGPCLGRRRGGRELWVCMGDDKRLRN